MNRHAWNKIYQNLNHSNVAIQNGFGDIFKRRSSDIFKHSGKKNENNAEWTPTVMSGMVRMENQIHG